MPKNIFQTVVFPATPEALYEIYMDAKKHRAATGMPMSVRKKAGSSFNAFGKALSGKILHLVPGRMIVQTWRSTNFRKKDADSILILTFSKAKRGAKLDLAHIGVSDKDYRGVKNGWPHYYWKPIVRYLKTHRRPSEAQ